MNIQEQTEPIKTKRPAGVTIAAIVLIVLSLFVAGLGIASQYGLLGRGGIRAFNGSSFRNRTFVPNNNFAPNGSNNGFPQSGTNDGQTNPGTSPNFRGTPRFGTGVNRLFRLLRPVSIGLDVLILVLSVVAAFGLFKSRRWGATLAIVISFLLILLAIPGLLRIFSPLILAENLVRILLAVVVIVLLLLPSARQSYLPVHDDSDLLRD